jgi:hypothetical protein
MAYCYSNKFSLEKEDMEKLTTENYQTFWNWIILKAKDNIVKTIGRYY